MFYDVSNDALKQTIIDTYDSFVEFFKKESKYPRRKSFYLDTVKIKFTETHVKLEKITTSTKSNRRRLNYIKLGEKNIIPQNVKYYNPSVIFENDKFWLVVSVEDDDKPLKIYNEINDKIIGLDLNLNHINFSDGTVFKTISKSKKYKKIERKYKRYQRSLSKKHIFAKENNKKLSQCSNYKKNRKMLRIIRQSLTNLRNQSYNEIIDFVLNNPPKRIVIETLDVKSMQKFNIYLLKSLILKI